MSPSVPLLKEKEREKANANVMTPAPGGMELNPVMCHQEEKLHRTNYTNRSF